MSRVPDLATADALLDAYEGSEAYVELTRVRLEAGEEPEVLWRLAQACYIQSNCSDSDAQRFAHLLEGREAIVTGLAQTPTHPRLLYWAPIVVGSLAENAPSTRERIRFGHEFKQHIDTAIALLPPDFAFLHMRGRFRFAVAGLSFMERGLASLFFGTPPSATYEEALADLQAAQAMDAHAIDNMLFLGKTLKALGRVAEARRWLGKVSRREALDCVDREQIDEATRLLAKLPAPGPDEEEDSETEEEVEADEEGSAVELNNAVAALSLDDSDCDTAQGFSASDNES